MQMLFSEVPERVKVKAMTDRLFKVCGNKCGGSMRGVAEIMVEFDKVRTELFPDAKKYMIDSEEVQESIRRMEVYGHG